MQQIKGGATGPCVIEGCDRGAYAKKFCRLHYEHQRRAALPPCRVEGCDRRSAYRQLCETHWRHDQSGDPLLPIPDRPEGYLAPDGYRRVFRPEHPNAWRSGYMHEHVEVMSEILGRPLLSGETVHHRNGNRSDNRVENLELWVTYQPRGQRPVDLVEWAEEIIRRYRPNL